MSAVLTNEAGRMVLDLSAPHTVYKNSLGKRVPGVTTINGVLSKDNLIPWAAKVEREGLLDCLTNDKPLPAELFHAIKRDKAANVGTIAHAMAQAFVLGVELETGNLDAELVEAARAPFQRFADYWTREGFELVESEFGMVSEDWQVGGTADLIVLRPDGTRGLMDLKTTKASKFWPYDETFAQVAAYAEMYREVTDQPIQWIEIARIGNAADDAGDFYPVRESNREAGLRLFLAARAAYEAKKGIKR